MNDTCKICGTAAPVLGSKMGKVKQQEFEFRRCPKCFFAFVANPWTDYANIYNEAYYRGQGPDPWIDYVYELENPEHTVRTYEWRGILKAVASLYPLTWQTRWLDFGCGNGGLVRHVAANSRCRIEGFEEGWAASLAQQHGIPVLNEAEMQSREEQYDIITAIEVIEHVEQPVEVLRLIRKLLKPGGLLFLTTGNAKPNRDKLLEWGYAVPEIHISFFEPETMALAMQKAGLSPEYRGFLPGFADIIRYKVLKNLRQRKTALGEILLPWGVLSRLIDKSHRVTAHPVGWKK